MIGVFALALATTAPITITGHIAAPFPGSPVPDPVLAQMRGGIRLPNGLDLSLGIDIQTRVNGLLALHTVYASDGVAPGIRVYTDGTNPVPLAPTTATINAGAVAGVPLLVVDRSATGTTIIPTSSVAAGTVNLVNGDPSTWLSGAGQTQIPVTPNGPPVAAAPGNVTLATNGGGAVVTLSTPTLEVEQLVGQATGVVVANTANNQSIETVSSINVDLHGLPTALLSSTFIAQRTALNAMIVR